VVHRAKFPVVLYQVLHYDHFIHRGPLYGA
jgi:hypothetical protein